MSRPVRLFGALALTAVLTGGCGGGSASGSAGGAASKAGTVKDGSDPARSQALQFSACMRANGVADFPDPGAGGELTIDAIANGSSVDTNSAAFHRALTACKDLEPAGFTGRKRTGEQQAAALGFARCMRDNGVKDFPDPTTDSPLIDTTRIPSTATQGGMSILHAAMQKCSSFAAGAGVRRP